MTDQTTIFGASDDLIEFRGGIYEEFNDYNAKNELLECSDGTRFRVSFGPWKFKLEHAGPSFIGIKECDPDDRDEYTDTVTMGPIDWVKYTCRDGSIQRAYRKGFVNPADEIRKLIQRHGEEAAEHIQDLFEQRQANA